MNTTLQNDMNSSENTKFRNGLITSQFSSDKIKPFCRYTCLLPVYNGDNAEWLKVAADSMLCQSIPPEEMLIAVDGEISESLSRTIENYKLAYPKIFTIIRYPVNSGLGLLLQKTLPLCRNEYIVRMDADDYSLPERVEKQIRILEKYPLVDVVGCNVDEFEDDINITSRQVILPETPIECRRFAVKRCPIRHPALLFRKSDILMSGNYSELRNMQDYELVVRLMQNGLRFYNLQEPLVKMRIGGGLHGRRGGVLYVKTAFKLKMGFYRNRFMTLSDFFISFGGQVLVALLPNGLRKKFYDRYLRKMIF